MKKKNSRQKRNTINQRIDVAPEGGVFASWGYYAPPVQKVIEKWKGKIPDEFIEETFRQVARCLVDRDTKLMVEVIAAQWWPFVWEIGAALSKVLEQESPTKWLLRLPLSVQTNGAFDKWDAIVQEIIDRGGPKYAPGTLSQKAKRMKMLTPPAAAKSYAKSRPAVMPSYKVIVGVRSMTKRPRKMS